MLVLRFVSPFNRHSEINEFKVVYNFTSMLLLGSKHLSSSVLGIQYSGNVFRQICAILNVYSIMNEKNGNHMQTIKSRIIWQTSNDIT